MTAHTEEPWRAGRDGSVVADSPVPEISGSDAVEYYGGHLICESVSKGNARRIVAAVNACEGIGTEYLERFGGTSFNHFEEMKGQRYDLLVALEMICGAISSINSGPQHAIEINEERTYWQREDWVRWMLDEILPAARAVSTKAKGGAQ